MNRRDFLKTSAAATAAAIAGSPLKTAAATKKPSIKRYQAIGKTGLKMSDISLGSVRFTSASLVLRGVDRGINYIDTSPDYGQAEKYIGEAMKKLSRDKLILASKFCTPRPHGGHLRLGSTKKDYTQAVEDSLSRLNTDYLDICFIHSIGSMSEDLEQEKKRLLDQEMLSAVEALKKAGKIRFLGVSSHGPHNMEELLMIGVKSGHFDVIMPTFNFMSFTDIPDVLKEAQKRILERMKKKRSFVQKMDVLKEAKKREIGVIAMKTLAGERDFSFSSKGVPFQPAAFKWVLSHPEVSGLVVTFKTISQFDLYLTASGERFTSADRDTLSEYAERYSEEYCRTGCNDCESACPEGVDIATTFRYEMYFRDYGMEKTAMESYTDLKNKAESCLTCEDESCAGACPYGLSIKSLINKAHETLSFRGCGGRKDKGIEKV
jgi:predicted aldo/keto reductase-like oxidoreductase